ncbi:glycosyltransferase family 2 protein [Brevibacterium sp. HMSC22B09]|uniref:glycosyltransferase family 2 protein n=1 Tax=Brevibacterium sp. HMSC22B09 TaxID=1581055 RepID=UPI0008A3B765|nr:glycosyltransferase family 2 protein [Brevibacterium sp. HMSC22B09]OFT97911.1 hypothetical protein HMPREF3087_03500 [Brevibacterium sp. HMSC22B09]
MSTPLLSLIIPAKDCAEYLPTLFESLLFQGTEPGGNFDLSALQIIFINDGGTDNTPEVLNEYGSRFADFTVLTNPEATGLANGRNQGLEEARGRYIQFLDGDDWLSPGLLTTLTAAIDGLGVDFVRTDHTTVLGNKREIRRAPMALRNRALNPRVGILPSHKSTMVDYPYAWAGIFDGKLRETGMLHFPKDFMTAEDRSWIWNLHLNAESFAVVSHPGVCYRRGLSSSLTQIFDERQLMFLDAFELIFDLIDNDRERELLYPKAARNWLALLHHHHKRFIDLAAHAEAMHILGLNDSQASGREADPSAGRHSQQFEDAVSLAIQRIEAQKAEQIPPAQHIPHSLIEQLRNRGQQVSARIPRTVLLAEVADSTTERRSHVDWFLPSEVDVTGKAPK